MKFDRVILVGHGAGGKDFLKRELEKKDMFKCSVSHTTRPPRPGEIDGVTYHYVTEETFLSMINNDEFREWNKFADKWYYGTSKVNFNGANLFIMTPSGVRSLTKDERDRSLVIYIDIPEEIRIERLKARKDADDPTRRIHTDRIDFADFSDFDWRITNPNFDPEYVYNKVVVADTFTEIEFH